MLHCFIRFSSKLGILSPQNRMKPCFKSFLQLNKYNKSFTCNVLMTFIVKMIHGVELILIEKLLN